MGEDRRKEECDRGAGNLAFEFGRRGARAVDVRQQIEQLRRAVQRGSGDEAFLDDGNAPATVVRDCRENDPQHPEDDQCAYRCLLANQIVRDKLTHVSLWLLSFACDIARSGPEVRAGASVMCEALGGKASRKVGGPWPRSYRWVLQKKRLERYETETASTPRHVMSEFGMYQE